MNLTRRALLGGAAATAALAHLTPAALAQGSKVMVLASAVDIPNFDPHVATGYAPAMLFRNVYDPLVRVSGNPPEIEPGLASEWTMSDDGLTYTFKIDPAAVFHDGSKVTAEDVVWSIERILKLQRGNAWMIAGVVEPGTTKALDDSTVEFNLAKPYAPFLQVMIWMFIINKAAVEPHLAEDDGQAWLMTNIAGSGPFTLGRYQTGNLYQMMRAKNDWHANGGNLDGAIWKITRETSTQRLMVERGEAHMAMDLSAEDMKALEGKPGVDLVYEAEYRTFSIKMNTQDGPLQDVNLRRAISYAYDYDAMLAAAGPAELMTGPLPTGILGFDPELEVPRRDMEKAREYLAQSDYAEGGFTLTARYAAGYENMRRWALILLETLKEFNITLDIQPTAWPDIVSSVATPETAPDFHFIFQTANYADPDNIAYAAYHSSRNGTWQNPTYSSPEVDALIEAARGEVDADARAALYGEFQRAVVADAPDLFGVLEKRKLALRDNVQDFVFTPVAANAVELLPLSLG
ncbi:ABC transporter substrate-binding protein [Alloyangia pacifica]|uniref:ABC transporter substrate-binding protein n=1 Tax=Alloyangia pacifica TaxID=311180 RepID=UPI001CFC6D9E|nr:ABC transporter substrate-binding protein [Alloyangia pacifica]